MKYKIEYQSAFELPQHFETNSKKEMSEIVFEGHQQQYLVFVNGEKKAPISYIVK